MLSVCPAGAERSIGGFCLTNSTARCVERDQEPLVHSWEAVLEPSALESCVDMVLGIRHNGGALAQEAMFRQMLLGEVTSEKKVFRMGISVTCSQR